MKSGKKHQKSKNDNSLKQDPFRVVKIVGISVLALSLLLMLLSVALLFFIQAKLNMPVKTIAERQDDAKKHISLNGWKRYKNNAIPLTMLIPPHWKEGSIETTEKSGGPFIILSGNEGEISLSFGPETESTINCSGGIDSVVKINIQNRTVAACYVKQNWHTGEYLLLGNIIEHSPQSNNSKKMLIENKLNTPEPVLIRADINLSQNTSEEKKNREIVLRILSTMSFN